MTTLNVTDTPKMLRETLAVAQTLIYASNDPRKYQHATHIQHLIDECDRLRPLGPDGKHGDLHTQYCGCDPVEVLRASTKCGKLHDATVNNLSCPDCIAIVWPKASV